MVSRVSIMNIKIIKNALVGLVLRYKSKYLIPSYLLLIATIRGRRGVKLALKYKK